MMLLAGFLLGGACPAAPPDDKQSARENDYELYKLLVD